MTSGKVWDDLAAARSAQFHEALTRALGTRGEELRVLTLLRFAPVGKFRAHDLAALLAVPVAAVERVIAAECIDLGEGWYCIRPDDTLDDLIVDGQGGGGDLERPTLCACGSQNAYFDEYFAEYRCCFCGDWLGDAKGEK